MFFRSGLVCKVTGQEGSPSTTKLKAGVFDFSVQRLSVLLVVPSLSRRHREGQFNQTTQSGISVCVCCICQGATCTSQGLMRVTSAAVVQIQRVSQHGSRRQNRRRGSRRQVLLQDTRAKLVDVDRRPHVIPEPKGTIRQYSTPTGTGQHLRTDGTASL